MIPNWPTNLISSIAERRCILFIGSGVSSTAKNEKQLALPDWENFLKQANELIHDTNLNDEIAELIAHKDFLLALQAIYDHSDNNDYYQLLSRTFNNQSYKPSKLHEIIHRLDSRIVMTTNFDKLYETYCHSTTREDGYKILDYTDKSLCDEIRSSSYVIIKLHGTIDRVRDMIFTKRQYLSAKYKHSEFYTIVRALFLTNIILFIGCGLNDPDILLLLEETKHLSNSDTHNYMLTLLNQSQLRRKNFEESYGISCIEYGSGYNDLETALSDLLNSVESWRFERKIT